MNRTVWHHKEVFQSPPRGVFRSRFLWDSPVVFTLLCSLIILQASCIKSRIDCFNYSRMVGTLWQTFQCAVFTTHGSTQNKPRCPSALPCFARALLANRTPFGWGSQCCLLLALARWCSAKFTRILQALWCLWTTQQCHSASDTRPTWLNPAQGLK